MLDRLRDFWERLGNRERRLLSLLVVTTVICGILYVGFIIQDGLSELGRHNDETRSVLADIESRREELLEAKSKANEVVAMIGEEPTALSTYLEKASEDFGLKIKNQQDKPTTSRGKFHEHTTEIQLLDLTLDQLARFLQKIETQSPVVVTTKLNIKRSNLAKEKMDRVTVTVATYSRGGAKKDKDKADKEKAAAGAAASGEGEKK